MQEAEEQNIKQPGKKSFFKELLSGSMVSEKLILNNLGYVLFLTFLAVIYISNRYNAEKIIRETTKLQSEVKNLKAEALSTSSKLMNISRQSKVYNMVKEKWLGLEELKTPPYSLIVNRKGLNGNQR